MTTDLLYEIRVRGGTRSVLETEKVYKGQFSDSRKIMMKPNCEKVQIRNAPRVANEFTPTMMAVVAVASFALLLVVIAILVWRYDCCQQPNLLNCSYIKLFLCILC